MPNFNPSLAKVIKVSFTLGYKIKELLKDKSYLDELLKQGAKRADLIAKNNLKEIYEIIGLTKFT